MRATAAISGLSGRAGNLARPDDQCLNKTLELAERMLQLADEGDTVREDPGCGVLYGVLRDSAYKLKRLVEAERQAHWRKRIGGQNGGRVREDG
jgi:hypothetical protein